ncbi:phage tail protein [Niallia sp.]|uniref:phage tail protein n=1 Tax=Niallia sp. TaxID=2837523 RepID=UPI00289F5E63|nr:phage tail protein [Niallia sp.]
MKSLAIKSITGEMEPVYDYTVTRNNGLSGEKTIKVTSIRTEQNESAYPLIVNENIFVYEDEEYVIKDHSEITYNKLVGVQTTAIHIFFDDLKWRTRQYDTISGTFDITYLLNFALKGSGYTFTVDASFIGVKVEVQNFGDDNGLALFQQILELFAVEYDYSDKHIFVSKRIGEDLDVQFRHRYNISSPTKDINTNDFATYMKGYGKLKENHEELTGDDKYIVVAEYTSPLAQIYGIRIAEPVRDERYTNKENLLERLVNDLTDKISVSLKFNAIQLAEMDLSNVKKGDAAWCIIEPFGLNIRLRIVDVEDYANGKSPVFTFGVLKNKSPVIIANFSSTAKTVGKVIDNGSGTIKQQALNNITFDLSKSYGRLSQDKVSVGPNTVFAEGYDPTQIEIPEYPLASSIQDGLMSSSAFQKVERINVDSSGNVVVDLTKIEQEIEQLQINKADKTEATVTEKGLMSALDKKKLNQILIDEGQVANLSNLMQKIQSIEEWIQQQEGGTTNV